MIKTQHAIGALVGSAVGDALGAPFEFQRPGLYRSTYPAPVLGGIGEMRGGGGFKWKPGEFTDDTQMALALAESLIANEGFDAADLWHRWRAWARKAPDVGTHTREVLAERSHVGAAERVHGRNGQSAGNGSVMRNTPIALWAAEEPLEGLAALATQQALLTHHDPHNGYGAAIHAAMIRAGMRGEDVFAAVDAVLAILPAAARERWAPLLASGWQPDSSKNNGTVWACLAGVSGGRRSRPTRGCMIRGRESTARMSDSWRPCRANHYPTRRRECRYPQPAVRGSRPRRYPATAPGRGTPSEKNSCERLGRR